MAKFCGNCGMILDDNAKICGNCGAPLDGVVTNIRGLKVENEAKKRKRKKIKRIAKLIIGIILFIVVAVIALQIVFQNIGYNGLVRKTMNAYKKYDIDTIISLSSDMYYYGEDDVVQYYFESAVGETLDTFESTVGHNYKFSYKVNETYKLSERKLDEMIKEINYTYPDFDTAIIENVVVTDLTVTAKKENKSVNRNVSITMTKEDGVWKVLYIQ